MNRWMNLRRRRRQAPLQLLHSRTCKKERTNERRNERLHGQTAVQAKRANTHMHTLLTLPFLRVCVCGRVKVKFTATTTTPAPRVSGSGSSSSDTLCSRRALKVNWIRRQATRQRRLRRRLWLNLLDEQLSAEQRRGSAACNSLAFNCLGVASHNHYLSAAQLHYEQRVCVWVRECDRITTSRWQICDKENLSLSIKLFNLPNENASRQCWTLYPFPSLLSSLTLPLSVHQLNDRRRFKVLFIVYILCLTFLGNIFIYLFVSQYLRALHLNEFTSERERRR